MESWQRAEAPRGRPHPTQPPTMKSLVIVANLACHSADAVQRSADILDILHVSERKRGAEAEGRE